MARLSRLHLAALLLLPILAPALSAQTDFFRSLDLEPDRAAANDRDWNLLGWVTEKAAYGLESPGPGFARQQDNLGKLETSLFLQLDWQPAATVGFRLSGKSYHDQIYRLEDDIPWTRSERRRFRNRYEIRDFYLESQLRDGIYLKAGHQIAAWGMSEYLRVTDVINPEDQYTLGQQDLEDLRLQVPALLLGVNLGAWLLEGVVTHDAGRNDMAPAGDEFDQLVALRRAGFTAHRTEPGNESEYFLRASTHYSRGDLQLVAGDFNDNQLSLASITGGATAPNVTLGQQRMQVLGVAGNRVAGSWLVFAEAGIHFNRPVVPDRVRDLLQANGWDETDQLLAVVGAEYTGFSNLILALELDTLRLLNHRRTDIASRQQTSFGARFLWTGLNERLRLLGVWNRLPEGSGNVARLSVEYSIDDRFSVGALWVDYGADSDSRLYEFRNNDVFQLQLRYSFQH